MKWLILFLILVIPEVSNSNGIQAHSGNSGNALRNSSDGLYQKPIQGIQSQKPKQPVPRQKRRYKHGWYGPPYYLKPYNKIGPYYGYGGSGSKETIIIKEKEVIREVPIIVPSPEPEKVWVPPVYETKVVKGHYISGIKETVVDGYRMFTDDPEQKIWVPEKEIQVVKTPGYYK